MPGLLESALESSGQSRGLLGALMDKQFRSDVASGLLDAFNRGAVASTVGAPVDLLTMALRPLGYTEERPIGGSEWIGQKMENAGLLSSQRNATAELLSGLLAPAAAARLATLGNVGIPSKINGLASKSPRMSDPKPTPQRPFHDDYPQGAPGPDGSPLSVDLDGRPINPGAFIVGRRVVGGGDKGASPADADAIARALGFEVRYDIPRRDIGGDAGRFVIGDPSRLLVANGLDEAQTSNVLRHELGHGIESLTFGSKIPQTGTVRQAAQVYSDLNSTTYVPKGKIGATPESQGYPKKDWEAERMAEAIRAYMQDPNYMKTVAPQLAARIRDTVNTNPNLNPFIHFNSIGGLGLLASSPWGSGDTP